jgi:hypothetical protein
MVLATGDGSGRLKRNFQFDGFSVIRWGERFIDLHNAYDLERFGTDLNGQEVTLSFRRNADAIDPDRLPDKAMLTCRGNARLAFNDLNAITAPLDHEGIEIAYFDESCDWLSFLDEEIAGRQRAAGLARAFRQRLCSSHIL